MEIDEADLGDNMDQEVSPYLSDEVDEDFLRDEKIPDLNDEGMCTHIYHLLEQAYLHIVEPIECENCGDQATVFCEQCNSHHCKQCSSLRHKHVTRKNHTIKNLRDQKKGNSMVCL